MTWMVIIVLVINSRALSPVKNAGIPPDAYLGRGMMQWSGVEWSGVEWSGVEWSQGAVVA